MHRHINFLILFVLVLGACDQSGLKIVDRSTDLAPPADLSERLYFDQTGSWVNDLDGLPGRLLFVRSIPSGDTLVTESTLSITSFMNTRAGDIKLTNEPRLRYQSVVSNKTGLEGSLLLASASANAEALTEVVITDVATATLPRTAIPRSFSVSNLPEFTTKVLYINAAILTSIMSRGYTKVEGEAAVSGTAFGAKGNVYASSQDYSMDYKIGFNYFDITHKFSDLRGNTRVSVRLAGADTANAENVVRPEVIRQAWNTPRHAQLEAKSVINTAEMKALRTPERIRR